MFILKGNLLLSLFSVGVKFVSYAELFPVFWLNVQRARSIWSSGSLLFKINEAPGHSLNDPCWK